MSDYSNKLLVSAEHSQSMHDTGLVYGRINAFNDIINMLIAGNFNTGLDAAQAVVDMGKLELEANKSMTAEQYDADAKADNNTSEQFPNV